ncbi:MAG: FMN-binding protein, partial [Treponema sp.]|nr:FMN-binding protein [Treponema sp.]
VSCVVLALANFATAPLIAQNQSGKAGAELKQVFLDADSFEEVSAYSASTDATITVDKLYLAKKGDSVIGAVAQVTGPTYDKATIVLGLDLNQTITGVKFLSLTDTVGIGQQANDPLYTGPSGKNFYEQFSGKNASDGFVAGETFDAISGATITSNGVANLLSQGAYSASSYLAENYGGMALSGNAPVASEQPTIFSLEEAIADILEGKTIVTEDIAFDSSVYPHNMLINQKLLVKDEAGSVLAVAVSLSGQTYSEDGGSLVALVNQDRTILGVRLLRLNDTPNLGMNTAKESFYNQFSGKSSDQNFRPGTDYDVVSGASISSDCVADMVKVAAYEAATAMESHGGKKATMGSENYELNEHYLEE